MKKRRLPLDHYVQGVLAGNRAVLSRAITLVESSLEEDVLLSEKLIEQILPYTGCSLRVGVTGVPGVGKSTFIGSIGNLILDSGRSLAVLAIDPSSQKTHGSILGDKTRMERLTRNQRVYIRPSPTGKSLGGVAAKTRETMLLCEAAGFDTVIIETVGVGQSETAVKNMVDFFLLLLITGAGDELQGIKKGIMEMADLLVINKADGDNLGRAAKTQKELKKVLHYFPEPEKDWAPSVMICSAHTLDGLKEIWSLILDYVEKMTSNGFLSNNRKDQQLHWMEEHIEYLLRQRFYSHSGILWELGEARLKVKEGEVAATSMARNLVRRFFNEKE
jgi:LAO/AO transport system kinase